MYKKERLRKVKDHVGCDTEEISGEMLYDGCYIVKKYLKDESINRDKLPLP